MEAVRNNSKKRSAIYQALLGTKEHPTADMLCAKVRQEIPELSLATVYRNLAQLEQDGLVQNIGTVAGQARYDARMDPHPHFVCTRCGCVHDLELQLDTDALYAQIRESGGHTAESHSLLFRGVCSRCSG